MAAAITAAANAGVAADTMDLTGEARAINDEGWSAIALIAVAVAGATPLDFTEARELIARVAHGGPRAQLWREVIGRCVAAGRYDLAVGLTDEVTDDAGLYLAVIAGTLGFHAADGDEAAGEASPQQLAALRRAAGDALLHLLPRCARHPEAAYAACLALALAFPADAAVVAGAVAQHAAALTACTASELAAGAVTCGLAGWAGCGKIAVCVPSPALPDHDPGLRLAGAARPQPGVQGRGDHGAPS